MGFRKCAEQYMLTLFAFMHFDLNLAAFILHYTCALDMSVLCLIVWRLSHPPGHRTPPARSGHRCVADNANLYVFGGYNPDYDESGGPENEDYPLFRELWRYHFATGCWQQIQTDGYMPTELASMSGKTLCSFLALLSNCLWLACHFEV